MGRVRGLSACIVRDVDGGEAVLQPDPDLADGWILFLDDTQQSHVDLLDPTHLGFEYVRRVGHVIDLLPPGPLQVVHLGGGAMTLARYTSATRPRSHNLVVERDAGLVALVREFLPWPRTYRIQVRTMDARTALDALPDSSADVVVLDVFDGARTPGNLTSREAFDQVSRVLTPSGTLVANIADEAPLTYARRFAAGLAEAFATLIITAEASTLRGRRFGNLVLIAQPAGAPALDLAALTRRCAGDMWPARVLVGPDVQAFIGTQRPFDDATAPGSPDPPAGVFG